MRRLLITTLLILILFHAGCSDWWTYNFWSRPPRIVVVPQNSLEGEVEQALNASSQQGNGEQIGIKSTLEVQQSNLAMSQRLADQRWGNLFAEVTERMYGWKVDFCELWLSRNHPDIRLDKDVLKHDTKLINSLKEALWRSYLEQVYYDTMMKTETMGYSENKSIKTIIDKIVEEQKKLPIRGTPSVNAIDTVHRLEANLSELSKLVPHCTGSKADQNDPPQVSSSSLARFLRTIDNDHSQLLIDPKNAFKKNDQLREWMEKDHGQDDHALTVSKFSPASISPSIKRPKSPPEEKEKSYLLDLSGNGQQAVIDFAAMLARKCGPNATTECLDRSLESVPHLIDKLRVKEPKPGGISPFPTKQSFELNLSTALNSPDIVNRLDYVTTYIQFFAYPFPANGQLKLEKEFWARFKSLQMPRYPETRKLTTLVDLGTAWKSMRVQIYNVETLVQLTPLQEIAHVTRESTQGVEVKSEPSIELMGATKGKIEGAISASSSIKNTVSERILKELDRRSIWLSPERNILRLTQRGMEAINIGGTLSENVTLDIPAATEELPFIELHKNTAVVATVSQPLYRRVTAVAISLAVVREPFELRKSSSEKYGLPDSADAYYVVVVSPPIPLTLWEWDRKVDRLTLQDLDLTYEPKSVKKDHDELWFFSPLNNLEGPARISLRTAKELRGAIKAALASTMGGKRHKSTKKSAEESDQSPHLNIECRLAGSPNQNRGVYVILKGMNDVEDLLLGLGQDEDEKIFTPATQENYSAEIRRIRPFTGKENHTIEQCYQLALHQ